MDVRRPVGWSGWVFGAQGADGVVQRVGAGCGVGRRGAVICQMAVEIGGHAGGRTVIDGPEGSDHVLIAGQQERRGQVHSLVGQARAGGGGLTGGQERQRAGQMQGIDIGDGQRAI